MHSHILVRDMQVNIGSPVVIGIIAGIVTLNLILLLSWCIVKRRRSQAKRRLINAAVQNSAALTRLSGAHLPVQQLPELPDPETQYPTIRSTPSVQTIRQSAMAPYPLAHPKSPTRRGYTSKQSLEPPRSPSLRRKPSSLLSDPEAAIHRPPRPKPPSFTGIAPAPPHAQPASLRRRSSADTLSVYSSASVPSHDPSFRSFSLDPGPSSAPAWFPSAPDSPLEHPLDEPHYVWPTRKGRPPSSTSSRSGGEFPSESSSAKIHWKVPPSPRQSSRPHYPSLPDAVSIPPVPSLPDYVRSPVLPQPSPVALRENGNSPSSPTIRNVPLHRSTSHSSSTSVPTVTTRTNPVTAPLSPVSPSRQRAFPEAVTHQDTAAISPSQPPAIPARSPLRGRYI